MSNFFHKLTDKITGEHHEEHNKNLQQQSSTMQSNQQSQQQGRNMGQRSSDQQKNQGLNTEQFESGYTSQNPSGYSATRTTKTTTYGEEPMEGTQQWGSSGSGDDTTGFGSNTGRTGGSGAGRATRSSKMGGGGYDELEEAGDDDEFGDYSTGRENRPLKGSSQYQEGTYGGQPESGHTQRHQRGAFQGTTAGNDADQYGRSYDDEDNGGGNREGTEKKKNIVQKGADKAKDMLERL
ncbi:hypothetical protein ACO0QE_003596 [Hanseniaspora vineae]